MSAITNPTAFAKDTGFDVGSYNTQDMFAGYGTAFLNTDRFKLEMKTNIHLLGSSAAPFLSWIQMVRKNPTSQLIYSWMSDELFTHRDTKVKIVKIETGTSEPIYTMRFIQPGDRQAFEAVPLADAIPAESSWPTNKPNLYVQLSGAAGSDVEFMPSAIGLAVAGTSYTYLPSAGSSNEVQLHGELVLMDSSTVADAIGGKDGADAHARHVFAKSGLTQANLDAILDGNTEMEVTAHVWTPDEQLKGYAQGSGLPNETRKRTRSDHNTVQIFKTPYSIANTLKHVDLYGGPELARLRLRKAIQHKIEIERAIIFQGGGKEGVDWGELPGDYENPLTRFKGLGVGVTERDKAGFITTKNAEWDSRFQFPASSASVSDVNALCEALFDDTVDDPSSSKVVYASKKWKGVLSEAAFGVTGGQFTFGNIAQKHGSLGYKVKTLESPYGDLHFVDMPLFRGQYEDYALVVDQRKLEVRPLRGRDTTLFSNVGDKTIDGQLDYYLTETGFECRDEGSHAILKLV